MLLESTVCNLLAFYCVFEVRLAGSTGELMREATRGVPAFFWGGALGEIGWPRLPTGDASGPALQTTIFARVLRGSSQVSFLTVFGEGLRATIFTTIIFPRNVAQRWGAGFQTVGSLTPAHDNR